MALALFVCSTLSMNVTAFADEISFHYDVESAVLTVTGSGRMTDFTEQNFKTRPWHVYAEETRTVVIEDGIESIGDFAFARFSELINVQIPDSVTYIGNTAFGGNDKLREITIPDSVTEIGTYAFGYDYQMCILKDFVTYCSYKSAAQYYCIKSGVPFDVPMVNNTAEAYITIANEQVMWSFVAPTNGTLSFNSIGGKDTYGLIYDSATYSYFADINEMMKTALVCDDDSADGVLNFKMTCKVEAGKRYYLAAKFRSPTKHDGIPASENGRFTVQMNFSCTEHNFVRDSVIEEPTCTEKGSAVEKCTYCSETRIVEIDAKGHTPLPAVIENFVDSNCADEGSYDEVVYCEICDYEISRTENVIGLKEHTFSEYQILTPATCTDNAVQFAVCDVCDTTIMTEVENSALGHDYVSTVVPATCKERGYTHHECSRCHDEYDDNYTDTLAHIPSDEERTHVVEPSCEQNGSYIGVIKCTECGEILEQNERVIPALGHNLNVKSFDGNLVHTECDRCIFVKDFIFMDRYNTVVSEDDEWSVLDMNNDGFINAKDYVYLIKIKIV